MLQGVVFDFDGVLANSEPLHLRAYQAVLGRHGLSLSVPEYYQIYVGFDDETVFRELRRRNGLEPSDAWVESMVAEKTALMQTLLNRASPLFPGAATCVRTLAERVPIAVASGAIREEIVHVLDAEGLSPLFTAIVAAGETPRGKPEPDPYLRAVELLSAGTGTWIEPSHVVAIEDSKQGLASALAAGLHVVALSTTFRPEALTEAALVLPDISAVTYDGLVRLFTASA